MDNIGGVIVIVLALVALFVILEVRRRQSRAYREARRELKYADEMGPTHTGKFRVQDMLKRTEDLRKEESQVVAQDEHEPLPDPFSSSSFKKPE